MQRKKLDLSKCTPVTPETFAKWKEDRKKVAVAPAALHDRCFHLLRGVALQARLEEDEKKRKDAEKKGGRGLDVLSGRALFQFDRVRASVRCRV